MDNGKLVGFDGCPIAHGKQMPRGYSRGMLERDKTSLLPSLLWGSLDLISYEPRRHQYGADPYVLYDRWGSILYEWPEDYEPNWLEVQEVCQRLGLM